MKILLILVVILCSCNHSQQQFKEKIFISNDSNKVSIVGKWQIQTEELGGVVMYCNICPVVEFTNRQVAKTTETSINETNFIYEVSLNNVSIKFLNDTNQPYFKEKEYLYKIYPEDSSELLELRSMDGNNVYILAR